MKTVIHTSIYTLLTTILLLGNSTAVQAQGPGTPPQLLTIDRAVEIAQERNLTLQQAQNAIDNAGARVTSSFGQFLPQLSVSSRYTRALTDGSSFYQGIEIPGNRPDNSYSADASASITLFNGFANSAGYNSSLTSLDASVQNMGRARENVAHQTRIGYLQALRTEQIVEIRQVDLDLAREQLVRIKGRAEAGAGLMTGVYSQEAEVANAELAIEQARTDAIVARSVLSELMNYDPVTGFQLSSEGLADAIDSVMLQQYRAELGTLDQLLQMQLQNRRDFQAAVLKVEAAESSITVAKSGYYPSLSASLGWGWQKNDLSSSSDASLGLNFQYTLFDQFRTSEQVQLAEAQLSNARIELRQLELQAHSELQQAIARLEGAERQLMASFKAVNAARQSRIAADESYKIGKGNYSEYLLANAQFLNAQINQVNAVFNYRQALFEIRYLTGR